MIHKGGRGPGGDLCAALTAAAAVLFIVAFLLFQWVRPLKEPGITYAPAGAGKGNERVILLLADRLTYGDLRRAAGPNLSGILEEGAVALMNVRAGRSGSESGYLSLGTGSRAAAGSEGRAAFEKGELFEGEKAEIIFERRVGDQPAGTIFHLQGAALQERNRALPYGVTVGLMGEMLKGKGLTAAVWGNADGAVPNRSAVMVAMDSGGAVLKGKVGDELLREDAFFPYGVRTDVSALADAVTDNIGAADLHVVEFGDSSRLDEYWPNLTPARGEALFKTTMEHLDRLLGELQPLAAGQGRTLLLLSPSLPLNRPAAGEQLAPIIIYRGAAPGPGLLVGSSTRRAGLVQNVDLLSMVRFLLTDAENSALPPPVPPFSIIPNDDPLEFLDHFSTRAALVYNQRAPLLKGYVAILVAALLAAPAGLLLKVRPLLRPFSRLIELLLFVPPALLLLPGLFTFPSPDLWQSALILSGAVLLPALLLHPLQSGNGHLYRAVIGWGIALALIIDTLAGAPLQQLSLMSYDPIGGARYYGMGNEYMGVLIGAALLGTVSLKAFIAGRKKEFPEQKIAFHIAAASVATLYALIIFILAAPNFGANLGGTLAAAAAFGAAWAELFGMGVKRNRAALSTALFLLLAAGLLWTLNACLPQLLPSHVGLFGETLRSQGAAAFWETAWRKMSMNVKLVRYSIWGRALVTLVGLCVALFIYPGGLRRRLRRDCPALVSGVIAALAGAAAALLTNDSGVVAAATILLYAAPPALVMIMQKSYPPGQDIYRKQD